MTLLIVGSKGFIGSHLILYLGKTHHVVGCDVIPDAATPDYWCLNAEDPDYAEVVCRHAFDACINCSGAAHVQNSFLDPALDFRLNVGNVFKILDALRKHSPATKFLNLSSAAVYGDPRHLPVAEGEPTGPLSPYGFHKKIAEDLCLEFSRSFGLSTLNLRIFSAYGPGLRKQIVWDMFRKFLAEGETVELFGTGNETRDFIHVNDLTRLLELVLEQFPPGASILNAANGVQVRIADLASLVASIVNSRKAILFNGITRPGDPQNWQADIGLVQELGYRPLVSLKQGLQEYFEWLTS